MPRRLPAIPLVIGLALAVPAHADSTVRLIVKVKPGTKKAALTAKARIDRLGAASGTALRHVRAMALDADVVALERSSDADAARALTRLRAQPDVEFADIDRRRRVAQAIPINDPFAAEQRYLTNDAGAISAYAAWDVTRGSAATIVAVVDTGYRPHAAMAGRLLPGYDMVGDFTTANDGSGRDADASDPGDFVLESDATEDCEKRASSWHGTGVAGIIGANTNDGIWTAGIDWAARILPVRALGKCGGYDSDIVDGIAWAAGLAVPGAPLNRTPAHVINLSLGGDHGCPSIYPRAIDAAYAHGVTKAIVLAAGNDSDDVANHAPANCPGVIVVASTTFEGTLARYSNFGQGITLSAPGGNVLAGQPFEGIAVLSNTGTTTPIADGFRTAGGTSYSAPMVSGTIALMLAVAPNLTRDEIVSILRSTAKPFPAGSDCATDRCGAGIVDADGAVRAAAGRVAPATPNYEGLWWNSPADSESGWGINFAHQGDVIFATWFTYDATGKAWWLSMTAFRNAASTFAGTLFQTRGPAFDAVPFDPDAVTKIAVGTGVLTFTDNDNGTFAYTVNGIRQTKPITRQVFGPLPTCTFGLEPDLSRATNYQDLWWAAPAGSESGWGINFTQQGDVIFATWFTYEAGGSPLWLTFRASRSAPGVYTGTLQRYTGPPFNAAFDPGRVAPTPVGTATLAFANGDAASFTYTVNGIMQTKAITRQVFRSPGTICR